MTAGLSFVARLPGLWGEIRLFDQLHCIEKPLPPSPLVIRRLYKVHFFYLFRWAAGE